MDVTKHNFQDVLPLVAEALQQCQFYAFDCEMTGLYDGQSSNEYLDDLEDRYQQMVVSSRQFVINQFGLSAFIWEGGEYKARTFNFWLFPAPFQGHDRRFLCQASSMQFLAQQGFDFNRFIRDGVPFMPVEVRDAKLAKLDEPQEWNPIVVKKPEDVDFVARLVATVKDWLKGDKKELLLDAVNGYQRAIQYQALEVNQFDAAEPPGFFVTREEVEGHNGRMVTALKLTRASAQEYLEHTREQRQRKIDAIQRAAGFSTVFEMMRDSGKPAVGHNFGFDVSYSLESFAKALPEHWPEYKALVQSWFPGGLWDTKRLAAELPDIFAGATSLGEVYCGLVENWLEEYVQEFLNKHAASALNAAAKEAPDTAAQMSQAAAGMDASYDALTPDVGELGMDGPKQAPGDTNGAAPLAGDAAGEGDGGGDAAQPEEGLWLPDVRHAEGFGRYTGADAEQYAHEAGYDAYMTGASFACLLRLHQVRQASPAADQAPGSSNGASDTWPPKVVTEGAAEGLQQGRVGANIDTDVAPMLEAVQAYKGQMSVGRSDIPYAALFGTDPVPNRSHVLYIAELPEGTHFRDIMARCAEAKLGRARVSMRQRGTLAIVELNEMSGTPAQAVAAVADLPNATGKVMTAAAYSAWKRDLASPGPAHLASMRAPKRRRTEDGGAENPDAEEKPASSRCNIM